MCVPPHMEERQIGRKENIKYRREKVKKWETLKGPKSEKKNSSIQMRPEKEKEKFNDKVDTLNRQIKLQVQTQKPKHKNIQNLAFHKKAKVEGDKATTIS